MARRKSSIAGESLATRRHGGAVNKKAASAAASSLVSNRKRTRRECAQCGKVTPMLKQQLYCSEACRQKAKYAKDPARYRKEAVVARQNKKAPT